MGIIIGFTNYQLSTQQQMNNEDERIKEKIAITDVYIDENKIITNITISNIGAIEVKIRALYRKENGVVTFLTDPSTYIKQGQVKTINLGTLNLNASTDTTLIAATERGVRSQEINEIVLEYGELPTNVDTSQLSIGPLTLYFDSINYTQTDTVGNPIGSWSGYPVPTGISCSWEVNVTNIDPEKRDLTIDQYTGLTLQIVGGPQTLTWFLKPSTQTIAWNTTAKITFLWSAPGGTVATVVSPRNKGQNNIFLTFFGVFSDGIRLAQTIPFEAVEVA